MSKYYKVINNNWTRIHWVDVDKYTRVSKSKTMCGLNGKQIWQPMAVYFGGCPECKNCEKAILKRGDHLPYPRRIRRKKKK